VQPEVHEKVHPSKELKRYVLARFDQDSEVYLPLSKEEIVEFITRFSAINPDFNNP
jgi:hypothetical protein